MHSCLPGKKMPSCNKTVEKRLEKDRKEEYHERVRIIAETILELERSYL